MSKAAIVGRKKIYPERITLPLTRKLLDNIDAARGDEPRVDFIRQAIERELWERTQSPSMAEQIDAVLLPGESRDEFYRSAAEKAFERRGPPERKIPIASFRGHDREAAEQPSPIIEGLQFLIEAGQREILLRQAGSPTRKRRAAKPKAEKD